MHISNRTTEQWQKIESDHHLHPFTDYKELISTGSKIITSAKKNYIFDSDGNEILDMMVYPNPVDGNYVTILSPVQGSKEIQVFTVTGRKVMDTVINGNTLDVSSFNSGFYMLKVTINGQSKVSKLVVR